MKHAALLAILCLGVSSPGLATPLTARWPHDSVLHTYTYWATADRQKGVDPALLSTANQTGRPLIGWEPAPRSMDDALTRNLALPAPDVSGDDPFPSLRQEMAKARDTTLPTEKTLFPGSLPYTEAPLPTVRGDGTEPVRALTYDMPLGSALQLLLLGLGLAALLRLVTGGPRR